MIGDEPNTLKPTVDNWQSAIGFYLGVASVFLGSAVGALSLAATMFSAVGLVTYNADRHKNRWMGPVGLVLGVLSTLMYMRRYGHL